VPALLYLPWVPTVVFQGAHTAAPWSSVPSLGALWLVRVWLLSGPVALTALALAVATAAILLWRVRPRSAFEQLATLAWLAGGTLLLAFAANQAMAAWADRYSVVILGPLLLLGALAVARAGPAGLVALVAIALAWFHQPSYHTMIAKSNARVVAHRVAARLQSGDLVIDAIPESVPVMRFYLGPRYRYASALGPVPDAGVMDWRDALHRLRSEPASRVARLADGLPPGAHVVLLRPMNPHPSTNLWKEAIRVHARRLARLLRADPHLRAEPRVRPAFHGPKTALRAMVLTRRAD
jgi:mannosyltransferase